MDACVLDPLSYVAPARIKVLVKPWLPIKRTRYDSFLARLKAVNEVRLSDVPAGSPEELGSFNASAYPAGRIIFEFCTGVDKDHDHLESFEYYRRIFVILLVADGQEGQVDADSCARKHEELQKQAPTSILSRTWIFGVDEQDNSDAFTRIAENVHTHQLREKMSDLVAMLLVKFNILAGELRQRSTITSPFDPASSLLKTTASNLSASALSDMRISPSTSPAPNRNPRFALASSALTERAKMQGQGRIAKTSGDLFKLCGFYAEAVKWYNEAAAISKANSDHLWYAAALEGIGQCCVLMNYAETTFTIPLAATIAIQKALAKEGKDNAKPEPEPAPAPAKALDYVDFIPDLHSAILNLYHRSTAFPQDTVPPLCMAETALRLAKFLAAVHLAGGWNRHALAHIVLGRPFPPLTRGFYPPRAEIAAWAMRAYSGSSESLNLSDKTHILGGLAAVYGSINFNRRRAFFLREIVLCLTPALVQARVTGAAGMGVHPAAGLAMADSSITSILAQVGKQTSLHALLDDLCSSYGIPKPGDVQSIQYHALSGAGWRSLQSIVLKDCTALCEAIPDLKGVQRFTTRVLETTATELGRDDQVKLVSNLPRIAGVAKKYGLLNMDVEYWDPFLLRDCGLCPSVLPTPVKSTKSALEQVRDPFFLYNPYTKLAPVDDHLTVVQNEPADFQVTLQNPFHFDIEAISISLVTEGVPFDSISTTCFIYARSMQTVRVTGFARAAGQLVVKGCRIKLFGCKETIFRIVSPPTRQDMAAWHQARGGAGRQKRMGLAALHDRTSDLLPLSQSRVVEILAIPAQPKLSIVSSSLASQDTIVLLEGEQTLFQVTLENSSDAPATEVSFSFMDSTTTALQNAIKGRGKAMHELHELETFLYDRLALKYAPDGKVEIPCGSRRTYNIQAVGKRGLNSAEIIVDYGCTVGSDDTVFSRQLRLPIKANVSGSIEVTRADISPLEHANEHENISVESSAQVRKLFQTLHNGGSRDFCLLSLIVRNLHQKSLMLTVTLDNQCSAGPYTVAASLAPGQSACLLLPLKRVFLPDARERPIPSRSKKQFVVSSNSDSEQEALSRQVFWHREMLLSRLSARWSSDQQSHAQIDSSIAIVSGEVERPRSGTVEMRAVSMSPRMMRAMSLPPLHCHLSLPGPIKTDTFAKLRLSIVNQTNAKFLVSLQISCKTPALYDANQQDPFLGRPKSMQSVKSVKSDAANHSSPTPLLFPGCPENLSISANGTHDIELDVLALDAAIFHIVCYLTVQSHSEGTGLVLDGSLLTSNVLQVSVDAPNV